MEALKGAGQSWLAPSTWEAAIVTLILISATPPYLPTIEGSTHLKMTPASIAAQQNPGHYSSVSGEIVPAMFSASCGGRTRTLGRCRGLLLKRYPYYSVEDRLL